MTDVRPEDLEKSTEPCVVLVFTGDIEHSRCDGCDNTTELKVYRYPETGKLVLRKRLCPECAP